MYQDSTQIQQKNEKLLNAANAQQEQVTQMIDMLQTTFTAYLPYAIALSGLIILFMLINMMQKWRVHRAILHINKNLEKLVELQTMAIPSLETEKDHGKNERSESTEE